ncbi:hypothetical protein GCM10027347_26280 [Larkinella harenae]
MRYFFSILLGIGVVGTSWAQQPADTNSDRPNGTVPAHLKPIERSYGAYFYGGKRLRTPHSLEIPFNELDNPAVNRHFKTFRTLATVGQVVALVPLVYVLTRPRDAPARSAEYWAVQLSSVGVTLGLSFIGNTQVRKAVNQYNRSLNNARLGLSAQPLPGTARTAFGLGVAQPIR